MPPTIEELMEKMESLETRLSAKDENHPLPSEPHPKPVGSDGKAVEAKPEDDPVYTWDQLQQAVQENRISETQSHELWARQQRRLAVQEAKREILTETSANATATAVEREIERYREAIPAVMAPGSEQRNRVHAEYKRLRALDPVRFDESLTTELMALQGAFGPIAHVVKAVKTKPDGHRDVSSDDAADPADDTKDKDPKDTPPSSLSVDEKRYYEGAIRNKVYKDWGAVREELKFANSRLRRRYGARA